MICPWHIHPRINAAKQGTSPRTNKTKTLAENMLVELSDYLKVIPRIIIKQEKARDWNTRFKAIVGLEKAHNYQEAKAAKPTQDNTLHLKVKTCTENKVKISISRIRWLKYNEKVNHNALKRNVHHCCEIYHCWLVSISFL